MYMSRLHKAWSCALAAALLVGCSSKPADGTKDRTATNGATNGGAQTTAADPLAELDARLFAHVRVQTYGLTDKQILQYFPDSSVGTGKPPQFAHIVTSLAGALPPEELRTTGNIEMLFFAPDEGGDVEWALHLPVKTTDAFVKALGAKEDATEVGLLNVARGGSTLHVGTKQVDFPSRTTTDEGASVTVASSRDAALYAPSIIATHATEQLDQTQFLFWPRRALLTPRYAAMADELRSLLSVNGHALAPARAGLVNLQSLLYSELGSPSKWPETLTASATFKIRNNKEGKPYPKDFRVFIDVPVDDSPRLFKLWSSLETKPEASAPGLPMGESRAVLKFGRSEVEQAIDAILPEPYRLMLAATGEDDMRVLQKGVDKLLEHNRGGTSLTTYTQRYPLSGEVLFAFDAMDAEKLPEAANTAQSVLVERFLKPMHLGALTDVDTSAFTDKKLGLKGSSATFEVPTREGKSFTLGSCWALGGPFFYAYIGLDPCDTLAAKVAEGGAGENAPVVLESPLAGALSTLFVGPNQRVDALSKVTSNVRVTIYPQLKDKAHVFHVDVSTNKDAVADLASLIPELTEVWSYASSYDVSAMASRAAIEQAIYQEPGIMVLGPPGLLGALPPTYYFGLPFSVPPAPPAQLREAILGDGGSDGNTP